jgi:hypothetical protein
LTKLPSAGATDPEVGSDVRAQIDLTSDIPDLISLI